MVDMVYPDFCQTLPLMYAGNKLMYPEICRKHIIPQYEDEGTDEV